MIPDDERLFQSTPLHEGRQLYAIPYGNFNPHYPADSDYVHLQINFIRLKVQWHYWVGNESVADPPATVAAYESTPSFIPAAS